MDKIYTHFYMSHEYHPEKQKEYFDFAYQTGSDIWTHIPYQYIAQTMLPSLPQDSLVLDLGSGRGLWIMKLLSLGYRVLGIDYIESVVDTLNKKIIRSGFAQRGRILVSDILDIPFISESFTLITDIGALQHTPEKKWNDYVTEVKRVLQKDGYYLNVSLSKETKQFQGFFPNTSQQTEFYKFGVYYHFFTQEKMREIFEPDFIILNQKVERFKSQSDPKDDIALVFTLMKKG